ncbi:MAG: hypothetical protein NXY57DRAFT_798256 [Lentinula lateritia]|uniref:Mid2 domain-containing protein n=1 Tax=Lentinula lateritia TaxID=40482 RepID=A0ABQ8VSV6_9AGAR|nr:MAG: hypothetical protein NXY57DRAFT_798256 [Lentinula lateritia]KAJ4499462.1 hypothetical protein C8R41DRAFT_900228 [Lentinula lateritia]
MSKKITLTLLVYLVAIFAVSSLVEANGFETIHRRDHENLKRLIKKRATTSSPVEGVGSEPSVTETAAGTTLTSSAASSQASTSSTSAASTSASSSVSSSASSTTSSSVSSSSASTSSSVSSSALSSSASSSSSSSVSSSSSATSPTTTATSTFSTPQVTQVPTATEDIEPITSVISGVLVTLTESVAASSTASSSSSVSGDISSSDGKKAGITVVIVIASCVGGVAILWTIFRKWKLGRSSKFDQRLQPINWQPTTEDGIDSGIPIHRRRASDTSSFHSGVHSSPSDMGHRSSENGHSTYGAADLPPLPSHDFTVGPSHLTPVGGYADLARGPSPQPQMQENLTRGPSISRNYDHNVPLHHQTGYGATGGF